MTATQASLSKSRIPPNIKDSSSLPKEMRSATPSPINKSLPKQVPDNQKTLEKDSKKTSVLTRSASVKREKSFNPLKKIFHRSQSHHESRVNANDSSFTGNAAVSDSLSNSGSTKSRSSSTTHEVRGSGRARASSFLHRNPATSGAQTNSGNPFIHSRSSSALNSLGGHNTNPFLSSRPPTSDSPSSVLGTGTNIAAPRQPHGLASNTIASRTPSNSSINMVYNPYGTLSQSTTANSQHELGFYMSDGEGETKLLPLPLENPNEHLPESLKQYSVQLTDNFAFPERNSADDRKLGSGGSSEVRMVYSIYHKKDLYALKKFKLFRTERPTHFYCRCAKEFIIAKKLSKNIHIANTFYLVKVPTSTTMTRGWAFVMEYCPGGDLHSLITRTGWKRSPLKERFCLFKQVTQGLRFMHNQGVVHRDIKPENVLISKDGIAKLTDFGISDWAHEDPDDLNSPMRVFDCYVGSPPFSPPEVMALKNAKGDAVKPYDPFKMDCWALGMILFALVYQATPFLSAESSNAHYREYILSYDMFMKQNPHFKSSDTHRPGPGAEYHYGREFQNTHASRVAWRLGDPDPVARYSLDDVYRDPWWPTIEVCCEESDEDLPKVPELRKSSSEEHSPIVHSTNQSEEELTHTSNPFLTKKPNKSKSMLSIAESKPSPKNSPKLAGTADMLPTLNEEKTKEDEGTDGDKRAEDTDTPKHDGQKTPEREKPEEFEEFVDVSDKVPTKKISNLSLNDSDTTAATFSSTAHALPFTGMIATPVSRSSSVTSRNSSLTSLVGNSSNTGTPSKKSKPKKKVIHHHLEVANSMNHGMFSVR